jgi:hypothetical protein
LRPTIHKGKNGANATEGSGLNLTTETTVIAEIRARIVELVDAATLCPETRRVARVLAAEFARRKYAEGLELDADQIDIERSARAVLKKQLRCLYEGRDTFTPMERIYLQHLTDLVSKL